MTNLKRILLVEDNPNDAELALALLRTCEPPVQVELACDGVEALDYLYHRGAYASQPHVVPAVVLLDLKMPRVNGLEVLREVKADENLKSIPVVMLTSSQEPQDLRECYRLGANGYVVKPVDVDKFREAISNLAAFWATTNEAPPA